MKGRHPDKETSLSFSPNNYWLAGNTKAVFAWDLRTKETILSSHSHSHSPRQVQFTNNDSIVLTGGNQGLRRYELEAEDGAKGLKLHPANSLYEGAVDHFALSPDGRLIAATRSSNVVLLDASTGKRQTTLKGPSISMARPAFDPHGSMVGFRRSYWQRCPGVGFAQPGW